MKSLVDQINRSHEQSQEGNRPHLGCSLLGHKCDRFLWLTFRHALAPAHPGRLLRLFRRGRLEELTIRDDLGRIGLKVVNDQARVDFGCHVSGSTDGEFEHEGETWLLECKTHSLASFGAKQKKGKPPPKTGLYWEGLKSAKFQHWVQMQVYMLGRGLKKGLYYGVCKDDDRIYTEEVEIDVAAAQLYVERGRNITKSYRMPEPLTGGSPSWWECKFCDFHGICWKGEPVQKTCRTCAHMTLDTECFRCSKKDNKETTEVCDEWERDRAFT